MIRVRNLEQTQPYKSDVQPEQPEPQPEIKPILQIGSCEDNDLITLAKACFKVEPKSIEIIGSWIWLQFRDIPKVEYRTWLKERKFRFNPKRAIWQYAGTPSRRSHADSDYLKQKYGIQTIKDSEEN